MNPERAVLLADIMEALGRALDAHDVGERLLHTDGTSLTAAECEILRACTMQDIELAGALLRAGDDQAAAAWAGRAGNG